MSDQNFATDCPHRELAVGWALHALEPAEETLVAAHLPDCVECTRIVAETERIGASLGLSIPETVPSAGLEQRVLALPTPTSVAPITPLVPTRLTEDTRRSRNKMFAAAAAVLLVITSVGLGLRVLQLDSQRDKAELRAAAMSEMMERAADPASVLVPLSTADGRPMGMVLAAHDGTFVVPTAMPRNRVTDQIYVLWGLGAGAPQALTEFDITSDRPMPHDVPSTPGTGKFTGYAISLEPGRQPPAVPTTVVASGQVDS